MKILVTGGAGFLGDYLTDELDRAGHSVVSIDHSDGDLTELGVARRIFTMEDPEVVVHLAAQVGRLFGERDVGFTIESNTVMTARVAKATSEVGASLVYCSTSEVYGDQGQTVCHEYGDKRLPHNAYGLSKRHGEEFAQLYAPDGLKIVRPSMPYGPGVPPGTGRAALPNIIWQAETRQPIPVHRGSERSWCYVTDTVRAFRLIIERGEGIYNVGRDDNKISMFDVAKLACDMTGADPLDLIELVDPPPNQTLVKRLSMGNLREGLGWRPEVELDVGMARVHEWVKNFDRDGNWRPRYA